MFSIFKPKDEICRTKQQLAIAIIEGRVFEIDGWIYKYNPVDLNQGDYEPMFIIYIPIASKDYANYKAKDPTKKHYSGAIEVFYKDVSKTAFLASLLHL